jgi:hypothetical protein
MKVRTDRATYLSAEFSPELAEFLETKLCSYNFGTVHYHFLGNHNEILSWSGNSIEPG